MDLLRKINSGYELILYGVVGYDFTAKDVRAELAKIGDAELHVRIHSEGGYVMDGNVVRGLIKGHSGATTAYIDGVCASQATVIALACDKIMMAENANWMVHRPTGYFQGNADEFASKAKLIAKLEEEMIADYSSRTGRSEDEVRKVMAAETWFTATEAKAYGFIDDIYASQLELTAQVDSLDPHDAYQHYKITARATPDRQPKDSTQTQETMTDENRKIVAQSVGLPEDATVSQITARLGEMKADSDKTKAKAQELEAKIEAMETAQKEAEEQTKKARAEELVTQHIEAKTINEERKSFWVNAALANYDDTKSELELLAKSSGKATPTPTITGMMGKDDDPKAQAQEGRMPLSAKDYYKD